MGVLVGLLLCLRPAAAQLPEGAQQVRVRLLHGVRVERVDVQATGGDLTVTLPDLSTDPLLRIDAGETATISRRGGELALAHGDRWIYARALKISGATLSLTPSAGAARAYTGALYITPEGNALQLVNEVPLPDYVASVVASEYPFKDEAGARAMAVVARTYALRATGKFSGSYDHVDGTASQVYKGVSAVTATARDAAQDTRGEVVTYDGELIAAVYFSSSGGHTADNEDVWDADEVLPYLRGRPDPYDKPSPHHRWTARVSRPAVLRALSAHYNIDVQGFYLGDRSEDGRLMFFKLLKPNGQTTRVQANDFRLAVNNGVSGAPLKSTWFDARRSGDTYVIEGRGYGHGVGLAQWGAHVMAQRGHSYREILTFYYDGVSITTLENVPQAPVANAPKPLADRPTEETRRRIGW